MNRSSVWKKVCLLVVVVSLALGMLPARQAAAQSGVQAPYIGMWLTANELAALPTSGSAWDALVKAANASAGTPDIQNQDSDNDVYVLAKALVYARTGNATYRAAVIDNLKRAIGTEKGGRTLALARNLVSYVIAADLINLPKADASFDATFRNWLRLTLTESLDGRTLVSTHEERPNNWGTHAGASRTAVALYLGDRAQLDRAALVLRGWTGDYNAYHGFSYGELDWQCDSSKPVGVNPKGCTKSGKSVDGAQPEEMRRGGAFKFPPAETGYPWEALQGAVVQAMLLQRAGYPAFSWMDNAILRSVNFLYSINWPATSDDLWQVWLINYAYGTNYAAKSPAGNGKNMGWTDWTHQKKTSPGTTQPTAVPVQPTTVPAQPTARPTTAPVQPTAVVPTAVKPTTVPVQPTVVPTTVPVQPPAGGVIKTISFEANNLTDANSGADRVRGDVRLTNLALRGGYSAHFANVSDSYLQEDFNPTADLDVSFYLYYNQAPSSDVRVLMISNNGSTAGNLMLRSSGTLRLRNDSNTLGESVKLNPSTVYLVRIHQTQAGLLEAYVTNGSSFGAPFASISNGGWNAPASYIRFGATASAAFDGRIDDVTITAR